jgi:hypothetical protein
MAMSNVQTCVLADSPEVVSSTWLSSRSMTDKMFLAGMITVDLQAAGELGVCRWHSRFMEAL